jgi:hypothetical protein
MATRTTLIALIAAVAVVFVSPSAGGARQTPAPPAAGSVPERFRFPARAPLAKEGAGPGTFTIAFTGTTALPDLRRPSKPQPDIPYTVTAIGVSRDGRYLAMAADWMESNSLWVLDGRTGEPAARVDLPWTGSGVAVAPLGTPTGGVAPWTAMTQGGAAPAGGWLPSVLLTGRRENSRGSAILGMAGLSGARLGEGPGPDWHWYERRNAVPEQSTAGQDVVDVAALADGSRFVYADRAKSRLWVFARDAGTADPVLGRYYRRVALLPLPAAPLKAALATDGGSAWIILTGGPVVRYSLTDGRELCRAALPAGVVPKDLAVSPRGLLAVADGGPGRNLRLFDAATGKPRGEFGTRGGILAPGPLRGRVRPGAFCSPVSLDIDDAGNVYVLDRLGRSSRIVSYKPDAAGTSWDARAVRWAAQGQTAGACPTPDPEDPGSLTMLGVEGRAEVKRGQPGGWKAVRLVAPPGGWESVSDGPEKGIPPQETGVVRIGGRRFLVADDRNGRLALTEPGGQYPLLARPCWLFDQGEVYRDADGDGHLDRDPVPGLPSGLTESHGPVYSVARYRIDPTDNSLWAYRLGTADPLRFVRYPSRGLDATSGLPAWDWSAGAEVRLPGHKLAASGDASAGPYDFRPVGAALYVHGNPTGDAGDYWLTRYDVPKAGGDATRRWGRRMAPYIVANRDPHLWGSPLGPGLNQSGRDGPMNRPIGFSAPHQGGRPGPHVFLAYNTGIQAEALDADTGRPVALIRSEHSPLIWEDSPSALAAVWVPGDATRPGQWALFLNDNFYNRTALYLWRPP